MQRQLVLCVFSLLHQWCCFAFCLFTCCYLSFLCVSYSVALTVCTVSPLSSPVITTSSGCVSPDIATRWQLQWPLVSDSYFDPLAPLGQITILLSFSCYGMPVLCQCLISFSKRCLAKFKCLDTFNIPILRAFWVLIFWTNKLTESDIFFKHRKNGNT